jgi:hypothetical protein
MGSRGLVVTASLIARNCGTRDGQGSREVGPALIRALLDLGPPPDIAGNTGGTMTDSYNPIMRTFGRVRAALLRSLDVARHEVRPGADLETLIPAPVRRAAWRTLRRDGLPVPALQLTPLERKVRTAVVLKTARSFILWPQQWPALVVAVPLGVLEYWASCRRAVRLPLGLKTLGELVIYLTTFREHQGSGYRWTRNEIATKVRLIVAESMGVPLDAVQPETTLEELGAC